MAPVRSPFSVLLFAAFLSSTTASATQPPGEPAAPVDSLIVLFKVDPAVAHVEKVFVNQANTPDQYPELKARLGNPTSAARMLEGMTSPEVQAELDTRPNSTQAILERYVVLRYPTAADAERAKALLKQDEQVEFVGLDLPLDFSAAAVPQDRLFARDDFFPAPSHYQWGLHAMNLPEAWGRVRGFAYLGAADSGIFTGNDAVQETAHPDLKQNFRPQFSRNFVTETLTSTMVNDDKVHGTHVAGIISSTPHFGFLNNGTADSGVTGVYFSPTWVTPIVPPPATVLRAANMLRWAVVTTTGSAGCGRHPGPGGVRGRESLRHEPDADFDDAVG